MAVSKCIKLFFLPGVDDAEGPGLHAVDGPVGVALLVADGDGEAAKVGPDQVDERSLLASYLEGGSFAAVFRSLLELA